MPIKTRCECGAAFAAPDKLAGKRVKCPKCDQPVTVPQPSGNAGEAISATCQCGKSLKLPAKYAGKAVKCPACGQPLRVPSPTRAPASNPNDQIGELLDEVDLGVSATGRRCPNCRADLQPDDVLCVECGFHTESGKQIKTKMLDAVERDPKAIAMAAATAAAPKEPPKAVKSLAKLLNQVGMLGVVAAVIFVGYKCFRTMQEADQYSIDQVIAVMTGSGGFVLGGVVVLLAVPCGIAANLVESGKPLGRILSMVMGIIGLLGLITTLPAVLVLKLAFSDEVARFCR